MFNVLKNVAIVLVVTLALLFVTNVVAWFCLAWSRGDPGFHAPWQVDASSHKGIEIRKRVFNTDDESFLAELASGPAVRPHTVLQFTNGFSQPHYTVGIEGIRYQSGWTDEFVQHQLAGGKSVFVFGGSTTWGHGVPDNNTVVRYMGDLQSQVTFLNFGTNAYDSLREVDRLLYLLRQGYRPKAVIFIDGLNDMTTFSSAPYRSVDKPRTQGFLIDRGELTLTFGVPVLVNMLKAVAYAMPITHLYFNIAERNQEIVYGSLDANVDPLNYRLLAWYYENQFTVADHNADTIIADWTAYYSGNIEFVRQLGKAFNFKSFFVLLPLGMLENGNPFLTPAFVGSIGANFSNKFARGATEAISAGVLDMIDCQNALASVDVNIAFVDTTHYSPQGNEALAECIMLAVGPQLDPVHAALMPGDPGRVAGVNNRHH